MESTGELVLARTEPKWAGTEFTEVMPGTQAIPSKVEVIDVDWVGGAVADLLNGDTELKRVLLQEGQTDIQIEHDRGRKCIRILIPPTRRPTKSSLFEPSKALFEAYDRIAGHVRRAMTL
jgi:hypothetical protein